MQTLNKRRTSIEVSVTASVLKAIGDGMLAADRAIAGNARPGDKTRVEAALRLSDMVRDALKPVAEAGTVSS